MYRKGLENLLCISHSVLSQAVLIFFSKLKNKANSSKITDFKGLQNYKVVKICSFR